MAKQTGKQRAFQIELDHYKRHDLLWWLKIILAIVAVALCAGWWVWGMVRQDEGIYSRGPVSAVHAMWDSNCQVCHQEFSPTNERNWAAAVIGCSISADENCKSCHLGYHNGPTHHASQVWNRETGKREASCGSCHREHRGRDASLTRLPDSDCTHCHANLGKHWEPQKPSARLQYANVQAFNALHPDFHLTVPDPAHPDGKRVLLKEAKDLGRLKFNHQLHMTSGLVRGPGHVRTLMLDKIPEEQRDRYRRPGQDPKNDALNEMHLTCAACHQPDNSDLSATAGLPSGGQRPRSAGAYMLPIVYEQHCQVCHPLTFDTELPKVAVPHRLQPKDVHRFLWGIYTGEEVRDPRLRERLTAERQMPGKDLRGEEEKASKNIRKKVVTTEDFLFQQEVKDRLRYMFSGKTACGDCHHYSGWETDDVLQVKLPRLQPTAVPEVWLPHAKFDHAAHRAVSCRECHARAYADDVSPSHSEEDILIAEGVRPERGQRLTGIQLCQQCHSPSRGSGMAAVGGARFDCTECHRYHHGDRPLHGLGAGARDAGRKLDLNQFLKGEIRTKKGKSE